MNSVLRPILGMIVGWLIFAVAAVALVRITDQDPHTWPGWSFVVGSTLYGMFFAALAGWILALISREKATVAATILAVLIALSALAAMSTVRPGGSHWSQLATAIFIAPMIYVGARFQRSRR